MFGSISQALSSVKDGLVAAAAKAYLNSQIGSFGNVTDLRVDRTAQRLFLQAELKGEPAPITLEVTRYDLSTRNAETSLIVREVNTSKEWLTLALRQYIVGREFKLPSNIAPVLSD